MCTGIWSFNGIFFVYWLTLQGISNISSFHPGKAASFSNSQTPLNFAQETTWKYMIKYTVKAVEKAKHITQLNIA